MAKVGISSDIIKPFSGQGDVLAWLKKVRLVAKLEQLDNVASVLALYLDGDTLAVYMEIEEEEEEEEETTTMTTTMTTTTSRESRWRVG